ncbi:MAG: signal peptidase I [Emergencia sp.]|jgi:signal peptidase I|nr:signal peptidase I [Emergencia sp.]
MKGVTIIQKRDFIIDCLRKKQEGYWLQVTGDSMWPTLKDGDLIWATPYSKDEILNIGDIIVYRKFSEHLTVHRIVDMVRLNSRHTYFKTKGDNNLSKDNYIILKNEIIGIIRMEDKCEFC